LNDSLSDNLLAGLALSGRSCPKIAGIFNGHIDANKITRTDYEPHAVESFTEPQAVRGKAFPAETRSPAMACRQRMSAQYLHA
jgi:hypothetical protein